MYPINECMVIVDLQFFPTINRGNRFVVLQNKITYALKYSIYFTLLVHYQE